MSSLNQVNLIGNIGRDPEILKQTEQGDFVRVSLATTSKYRTKEGKVQEDTQWHTVYFSNGLGRAVSTHLKKGARVFVTGELRTQKWQDKEGQPRTSTAVYAKDVKFLSAKPQEKTDGEPEEGNTAYTKAIDEMREALGGIFKRPINFSNGNGACLCVGIFLFSMYNGAIQMNNYARDLFDLQSQLIDGKVDMAASKAIDRVVEQITSLRSEVHELRHEMNQGFSSLNGRVIAIETKLGMVSEKRKGIYDRFLDVLFKAGWVAFTLGIAAILSFWQQFHIH